VTLAIAIGMSGLGASIIALAAQIRRLKATLAQVEELQVVAANATTKLAELVLVIQQKPTWPSLDEKGRIVPAQRPGGAA
jgi:hypothetical protein